MLYKKCLDYIAIFDLHFPLPEVSELLSLRAIWYASLYSQTLLVTITALCIVRFETIFLNDVLII